MRASAEESFKDFGPANAATICRGFLNTASTVFSSVKLKGSIAVDAAMVAAEGEGVGVWSIKLTSCEKALQ